MCQIKEEETRAVIQKILHETFTECVNCGCIIFRSDSNKYHIWGRPKDTYYEYVQCNQTDVSCMP